VRRESGKKDPGTAQPSAGNETAGGFDGGLGGGVPADVLTVSSRYWTCHGMTPHPDAGLGVLQAADSTQAAFSRRALGWVL
jgi:hypothetical protein